jgi:hypothetical protein
MAEWPEPDLPVGNVTLPFILDPTLVFPEENENRESPQGNEDKEGEQQAFDLLEGNDDGQAMQEDPTFTYVHYEKVLKEIIISES